MPAAPAAKRPIRADAAARAGLEKHMGRSGQHAWPHSWSCSPPYLGPRARRRIGSRSRATLGPGQAAAAAMLMGSSAGARPCTAAWARPPGSLRRTAGERQGQAGCRAGRCRTRQPRALSPLALRQAAEGGLAQHSNVQPSDFKAIRVWTHARPRASRIRKSEPTKHPPRLHSSQTSNRRRPGLPGWAAARVGGGTSARGPR